jgi:CBS-domain-containing membrane protein
MTLTTKSLLELTAADVMTREVTLVPQQMSLPAAAHLLSQARISGAPVVDARGRLVGVLSTTDFVHWIDRHGRPVVEHGLVPAECYCEWSLGRGSMLPEDAVRFHMTADPVTAEPETPLGELARRMLDTHIHRIIVVDAENHPIGVVSSTDVLAAVAYAEKDGVADP